jgi:hypothetical protein
LTRSVSIVGCNINCGNKYGLFGKHRVAQHLETLGQKVIVADPTFAPNAWRAQPTRAW